MPFHDNCLDNDTQKCYSCIGLAEQRDLSDKTQQQTHETIPKSVEIETTYINESGPVNIPFKTSPKYIQPEFRATVSTAQRDEIRQKTQPESPNTSHLITDGSTYTVTADKNKLDENHKIRMKELKQLEQKLKKREEQLKMKEAMINENMKEKTNILDRLHKAEFRNLELENTIKTLYTKIESFQNRQNQHPPEHQNTTSTATDNLVIGIREKVTKYVLSKVDDEMNKLQNENKNTNNDTLSRQNQTSYDYKQMYPSNQQLYYRDSSYNQNYGEPPATNRYSMYGAQFSEPNQYWYRSENEDRKYRNHGQREISSQYSYQTELETRNICKDKLIEVVPNWTNKEKVQNHISVQNNTTHHLRTNDQNTYHSRHTDQPCIEIEGDSNIIIVSLYLPCKGPTNSTQELLECIDQLNETVCTYSNTHQIIIGGDFNEDIINGASSQRKKYINDFMQDHELSSNETGLTFIHSNGKDATAIDFILYQNKYSENIIDIQKLNVTSNVSDHYPLLLSVLHNQKKLNITKNSQTSAKTFNKRIKWDKIDTGKYASLISTEISSTKCKIQNREDLESGFNTLNNIIIKATKGIAPNSKKGKKKPKLQVMNEEILKAISNKKIAFYNWKSNGSINDPHNYYLKQKKLTTYELRKQCRLEIAIRRINERQKLIDSKVTDTKTFFRMIRNQRGKMSKHIDELNVDNQIYNSDNQIINGWHIHFGELAKKSVNTKFDHKHLESVEKEVKVISDICQNRYIHITKIATGTYIFQSNRASFNKNKVSPTCKLCNKSPEILSHFLQTCESLENDRKRLMEIIIDMGSELLAKSCFVEEVDLVQLIVNPFYYTVDKRNNEIVQNITGQLESVCRQLINNLHMKRYELLTKQQKCEKKNNLL
ncbi:unnamed protein product [Mytilus coruscus]|uniref:Endonuclease/exonuclease/phosphatase domain-containing protein n=1 Tax=Mytilus coruscus TaxID=42192 RepID=A0A6J8B7X6_MYTCO|nr:unnamed protein product [Mytilus coruscus]